MADNLARELKAPALFCNDYWNSLDFSFALYQCHLSNFLFRQFHKNLEKTGLVDCMNIRLLSFDKTDLNRSDWWAKTLYFSDQSGRRDLSLWHTSYLITLLVFMSRRSNGGAVNFPLTSDINQLISLCIKKCELQITSLELLLQRNSELLKSNAVASPGDCSTSKYWFLLKGVMNFSRRLRTPPPPNIKIQLSVWLVPGGFKWFPLYRILLASGSKVWTY